MFEIKHVMVKAAIAAVVAAQCIFLPATAAHLPNTIYTIRPHTICYSMSVVQSGAGYDDIMESESRVVVLQTLQPKPALTMKNHVFHEACIEN